MAEKLPQQLDHDNQLRDEFRALGAGLYEILIGLLLIYGRSFSKTVGQGFGRWRKVRKLKVKRILQGTVAK